MRRASETTKAAILVAARERFAACGYERATIRAIAADAAIDPAMVMRYFGNKERLFAAAADFDLQLPDLSSVARDQVGIVLAAHFLERWETDEALIVLLRTGVTNNDAAQRVRAIFAGQLVPIAAKLSDDPANAPQHAALAATQVLGMALCRYVLPLPAIVAMTREDIIAWIGPTLQRYLVGSR